ncbi:hypothetical protein Clacol_008210 [Clathrus columnatus]|uniref:protein-tyrosine-phosphatase n=1 Tax=Clathrus columnatus TaxID=1419009 RepID=A0AAV5AKD4_9AGAM|nr:hypothetical protein Clacol_008210 [Clathrus columnatus]
MASLPEKPSSRRLPTLTISPNTLSFNSDFIISPESSDEYPTPLSSTSLGSATFSALIDDDEKLAQDLAILEKLRRSVQMNLQLRPISSSSSRPGQRSPGGVSANFCNSSPINPFCVIYPESLSRRLLASKRPLLIDTRNTSLFHSFRVSGSVNIAIPSLILKRQRKAGGSFTSIQSLRNFITSEIGKQIWDDLLAEQGPWDGVVIIYDEEMDERERDSALSWNLLSLLDGIFQGTPNTIMYMHGGINGFRRMPDAYLYVVSGSEKTEEDHIYDLFTMAPPSVRSQSPTNSSTPSPQTESSTSHTPRAFPSIISSSPDSSPKSPTLNPNNLTTQLPSFSKPFHDTWALSTPRPAQLLHHRASQPNLHVPPQQSVRKASVPNLHRLDTSTIKLSIKTQNPLLPSPAPSSQTLTLPVPLEGPARRIASPRSPSFLILRNDISSFSLNSDQGVKECPSRTPAAPYFSASSGLSTPRPTSPLTARPPPTSPISDIPNFTVSCILPNFLFLGSELTTSENVKELQNLGVKRILNLAAECDPNDHGLDLRNSFERYIKIAMRDTVEEENISRGVREVCECLDDARLHSSPTYVHCKAGKSRSVTAVMAYLIHANHWTLSQAYAFVLERRKGISPNIGFVSELMNFEEQELGGKSIGVVTKTDDDDGSGDVHGASYGHGTNNMRRNAHMRESLPPALTPIHDIGLNSTVTNDPPAVRLGDQGQELEIKDSDGRYRHKRRAPVDGNTLQPSRRVSKAGLESGDWT